MMDLYPPTEPDWNYLYSLDEALGLDVAMQRAATLTAARRLLDDDAHAAYMVAACVSTTQSGNETRPAFVKRIVRAWLDEMGRVEQL